VKIDFQSVCKGLGQVRGNWLEQIPPTIAQYPPYSGYGYTGEWEDDNGLVYLRARYYNHEQGRFISHDPVEGSMNLPISLNRYAYADNNPVNKTDPSGRVVCSDLEPTAAERGECFRKVFDLAQNFGITLTEEEGLSPLLKMTSILGKRGVLL
jgi:RHS repeat-associated protein